MGAKPMPCLKIDSFSHRNSAAGGSKPPWLGMEGTQPLLPPRLYEQQSPAAVGQVLGSDQLPEE